MDRLRCGTIYTDSFVFFLKQYWQSEPRHHASSVPSLEYFQCKDGPRRGEQYMTIQWLARDGKEEHTLFDVEGVPLHLTRQTQRALKHKCLDATAGQMLVRG